MEAGAGLRSLRANNALRLLLLLLPRLLLNYRFGLLTPDATSILVVAFFQEIFFRTLLPAHKSVLACLLPARAWGSRNPAPALARPYCNGFKA